MIIICDIYFKNITSNQNNKITLRNWFERKLGSKVSVVEIVEAEIVAAVVEIVAEIVAVVAEIVVVVEIAVEVEIVAVAAEIAGAEIVVEVEIAVEVEIVAVVAAVVEVAEQKVCVDSF